MIIISRNEKKTVAAQVAAFEKELAATTNAQSSADFNDRLTASRARMAAIEAATKASQAKMATAKTATDESNVFRELFFVITFFTIGVVSNFKKLWEEAIGRLAAVYLIALFGFVI